MTDEKNNSGDENSGDWNSGDRNSGDGNSGDWNSGDRNSGDGNSGNGNSGNGNSGNGNSGNWNSGYGNSGYGNSGNGNSGNWNSGYGNSGYGNSGYGNSGCFNSDTPKVRIFNKDCNLDFDSEILSKVRSIIRNNVKAVCVWVCSENMSDEEKSKFPSHKTTGGYLKERDYKYCWKKGWEKMIDDDKKFIKTLPNFDKDIFFEITGINVEEPETKSIIFDGNEIKISVEFFESLKDHFTNLNKK
jgi:hypothetical protein